MATHANTYKPNTIVQYGSLIGAVIGLLTNTCGAVYNVDCGNQGIKVAKHGELTVLNTNYVGTNMRVSQFLPQIINRYEQIKARKDAEAAKYNETSNDLEQQAYRNYIRVCNDQSAYRKQHAQSLHNELNREMSTLKPVLRSKSFQFNSQYATPTLHIVVRDAIDIHGSLVQVIEFGEKELTYAEIGQLINLTNQSIAGLPINPTTMKIGASIGYVDTLREVIKYFKEINTVDNAFLK